VISAALAKDALGRMLKFLRADVSVEGRELPATAVETEAAAIELGLAAIDVEEARRDLRAIVDREGPGATHVHALGRAWFEGAEARYTSLSGRGATQGGAG